MVTTGGTNLKDDIMRLYEPGMIAVMTLGEGAWLACKYRFMNCLAKKKSLKLFQL